MYVVTGFKKGVSATNENLRLFLYPMNDIEAYCNEAEAILGSPYERRRCSKKNLETEEIMEGNACVLRILGFTNEGKIDEGVLFRTVERVMSRRDMLPRDYREPRLSFIYPGVSEVSRAVLYDINIFSSDHDLFNTPSKN